jgi:hypothetical protein
MNCSTCDYRGESPISGMCEGCTYGSKHSSKKRSEKKHKAWAIVDKDYNIQFTPGGSSSRSRLMVYSRESTAKSQLRFAHSDCKIVPLVLQVDN